MNRGERSFRPCWDLRSLYHGFPSVKTLGYCHERLDVTWLGYLNHFDLDRQNMIDHVRAAFGIAFEGLDTTA
jgi:hypothetical protein